MFWTCREREKDRYTKPKTEKWPSILIIIPSRNEEVALSISLPTLLEQDYPGTFSIIVVDDLSDDKTYDIAKKISINAKKLLHVVKGVHPPTNDWAGKVWTLSQGLQAGDQLKIVSEYYLFTDADIIYEPHSLKILVAEAISRETLLTSYMVKLNCESAAEKFLIPAFIYFFRMIYPFEWVNQNSANTAAAAGGCIIVQKDALERVGGLASIKSELIDDCALAKKIKAHGPIWLGLAESVKSIRKYNDWNDIRLMVSRTAYTQLNYSLVTLLTTTIAMGITFIIPPFLSVICEFPVNVLAGFVCCIMILSFIPTLRYYKTSLFYSLLLPLIALVYLIFTLDSAFQFYRGKGGFWKGRVQVQKN